jgi:hypothetical protein
MNAMKRFRRSGAGASREAQAERDAPSSVKLGMAEGTGRWRRGSVTIYGWTWFGFASEADMQLFQATWPTPPGIAHPDAARQ